MRIDILDGAEKDLVEGFKFYERQSEGMGNYFLDSIFSDVDHSNFMPEFTLYTSVITGFYLNCTNGVTSCAVASSTTSEGTTPLSLLRLAHATDQIPIIVFSYPYYDESLSCHGVIASPAGRCLDPLPRSVLPVHLLASSQETTASPQTSQVRHTTLSLQCNFHRVFFFGAAVIPLFSGSHAR